MGIYIKGKLIGRGKAARVYKISEDPHHFARKEFSPIDPVVIWNWFFYHSPHPLKTEAGHKYAFWKRKVAHKLCKYLGSEVYIPDALELCRNGFTTEFIEGRRPGREERRVFRGAVRRLEDFFSGIGMPTWSFSRRNPFAGSNFLTRGNIIFMIDYEQSVPVPDSKGVINYDTIYFDNVQDFIFNNRTRIIDKLGRDETKHLEEALRFSKKYHSQIDIRPKNVTKVMNFRRKGKKGRGHG
ncbi:MAG: hypothetical protein ISS26_05865 [Candidatus Omnitrophica bacterium]|nr:hypothetical protein [Candidatus Omnitrophota bacterium]